MAEQTHDMETSRTWILFESGNRAAVDLWLYAPPRERSRPIDAYVVTECEGDVTGSARRAVEAVYHIAEQHGGAMDPVVVGFDLQGLPGGRPVTGESGGLAFAVALAKKVFGKDPGPVAATGDIRSGHGGGPVGAVSGIVPKLEAAGRLKSDGTWVLYPRDNDREIPEDLKSSLAGKGLKLAPVSSVAEALGLLFELPRFLPDKDLQPTKGRRYLVRGVLIVLLVCATALLLARIHGWPPFEAARPSGAVDEAVFQERPRVVKDAQPTETGPPPAPPPVAPRAERPDIRPEIRLFGERGLSAELARLAVRQLENLLKKEAPDHSGIARISGRVVVLEEGDPFPGKAGRETGRMTVVVRDLTVKGGRADSSPRTLRLVVRGHGSKEGWLQQAASALAARIVDPALPEEEVRDVQGPGRGFD
jgi:hypothetical protein